MSKIEASSKTVRASRSKKAAKSAETAHDASNALIAEAVANNPELAALVTNTDIVTEQTDRTDPTMPMGENGNELVEELPQSQEPVTNFEPMTEAERLEIEQKAHEAWFQEQLTKSAGAETETPLEPKSEPKFFMDDYGTEHVVFDVLSDEEVTALTADLANVAIEKAESVPDLGAIDHSSQQGSWSAAASAITIEPTAYDKLLAEQTDEQVDQMVILIADAIDKRAEFEKAKNPENSNIQRTLEKARRQMVTKRAARVLLASNVSPDFVNRTLHDGSRYNVYAIGKLADVVYTITDNKDLSNAINRACMKSLFACKRAGYAFTLETAKAAASDKIRIDEAVRRVLVRHTVSASTAPTQSSSTMNAFTTLGLVKPEGSTRNPTYVLTGHPIVEKMEALMKAA